MVTRKTALVLTALAMLTPPEAIAASPPSAPSSPEALFAKVDLNQDGALDAAELAAVREEMFVRADANGDGFVQKAEAEAAKERFARNRGRALFAAADQDGDGQLSRAEFVERGSLLLQRFDRNRDGAVTRDEIGGARLFNR